jgi:REP element-mobilizing transposase RayT
MTYARKNLVSLDDTPYYHVVARCVRRAWLWGVDEYAGRDYSHRRTWVLERIAQLTKLFTIDVCAYAVMSNHYHLVVYVDRRRAQTLTFEATAKRWLQLFSAPPLIEKYLTGEASSAEREAAEAILARWRARLCDLSWFMKCLNEHLARRANAEDQCTGRFWEGRFRSQALLDEAGLLTAMAYVDLNPIRAGIAATPEDSPFTSIIERIRAMHAPTHESLVPLRALRSRERTATNAIPFGLHDYLELVDWTGRTIRADKAGAIELTLPPILARLRVNDEAWRKAMRPHGNVFGRAMGRLSHLRLHAQTLGQSWVRGLRLAERMFAR